MLLVSQTLADQPPLISFWLAAEHGICASRRQDRQQQRQQKRESRAAVGPLQVVEHAVDCAQNPIIAQVFGANSEQCFNTGNHLFSNIGKNEGHSRLHSCCSLTIAIAMSLLKRKTAMTSINTLYIYHMSVYLCVYVCMCVFVCLCLCVCVFVCV